MTKPTNKQRTRNAPSIAPNESIGMRNGVVDGFGARVRARRLELKLSLSDMAELMGVRVSSIVDYQRGTGKTSIILADRIAIALDTTLEYLIRGESK